MLIVYVLVHTDICSMQLTSQLSCAFCGECFAQQMNANRVLNIGPLKHQADVLLIATLWFI